jgi:hypothetical protein
VLNGWLRRFVVAAVFVLLVVLGMYSGFINL